MKKVTNEFGNEVIIDETTQELYTYNNKNKTITWNAKIIIDGKATTNFTNYTEEGTIKNIEDRLKTWNNRLLLAYSMSVNFNREENDPNNTKWNKFINHIKENEELFFTKKGDFRKKFLISNEEIKNLLKNM